MIDTDSERSEDPAFELFGAVQVRTILRIKRIQYTRPHTDLVPAPQIKCWRRGYPRTLLQVRANCSAFSAGEPVVQHPGGAPNMQASSPKTRHSLSQAEILPSLSNTAAGAISLVFPTEDIPGSQALATMFIHCPLLRCPACSSLPVLLIEEGNNLVEPYGQEDR